MKKLIFILLICGFFRIFANAQAPSNCLPQYPEFTYQSTYQVLEDEEGVLNENNYISISINKDTVKLVSELWTEAIAVKWELQYIRTNANNVAVYQWIGHGGTYALYTIPVIYKDNKWSCGYLVERLAVGTVYSTCYRNNLPKATHINKPPVREKN